MNSANETIPTSEIVALLQHKGLGDKSVRQIVEYANQTACKSVRELDRVSLSTHLKSNYFRAFESFLDNLDASLLTGIETLDKAIEQGCVVFNYWQSEYPESLKSTGEDAPLVIYLKGDISLLKTNSSAAIIGTRNNSSIGRVITERVSKYLSENNVCIVSGLALGIDSIAHQVTVTNSGKAIAVLVDVINIHPKKNTKLATEILENGGLLISENPPGINVHPSMFVKRDRIQSALSNIIIPIETSANGGTLHAVRNGIKYGKPIYVPDPNSGAYRDQSIPQLEGIIALLSASDAKAFTKSDYSLLLEECKKTAATSGQPQKLF